MSREITLIQDDEQAKAYLAFHNRLQDLVQVGNNPRMFCMWADEKNWNVAAHYCGYAEPQNNGYAVLIIKRDGFTLEEIQNLILRFTDGSSPASSDCVEYREYKNTPQNN